MAAAWFEWYKSTVPVVLLLSRPLFGPLAERIDRFLSFRRMLFPDHVDDVENPIDECVLSECLQEVSALRL